MKKGQKNKILLIGYAILSILALIFLFLVIFTEDNRIYLFVGLASVIVANILNFIRDLDNEKTNKLQLMCITKYSNL